MRVHGYQGILDQKIGINKEQLAKDMALKINQSLKYYSLQDCLLTMDFDNADIDPNEDNPFEMGLVKAARAIRGVFHQTYGASPRQLVFGRDMFMAKDTEVDWDVIKARKQEKLLKVMLEKIAKRRIRNIAQVIG